MGRPGPVARADAAPPAPASAGPHRRVRGPGAAPGGHPLGRLGDVLLHPALDRRGVDQDQGLRRAGRPRPGPAQPGRAGPAVHRRLLRAGDQEGQRVRRRLLRRAGLERGHAGVGGPRHARAVRRADRRLPRRRGQAPGVLPVQLRARAGAAAGHRGPAPARETQGGRLMEHVAVGGTLYSRTPMSLVFALLRQRRRHLTVSRPLACYEIELFLSAGALDRIVSSWVGIGLPWGLAPIFRHYVERGEVAYDEWSHLAMGLRYKAGAMGVPFLPTLTMLGSDLATRLDLQTVTCPYTGERLAAVPALNPDVALIHAHRADMLGNVQVDGYRHMDVDMARAARTVIVSAEQIVSPDEIAERPDRTMLPHFTVDAVVAAPHGAYPHECYGRYAPDLRHFDGYAAAAKEHGPAAGLRYVEENVDVGFASFKT